MQDVSAPTSVCSACGEPLGTTGVCIACLLRTGLDEVEAASASEGDAVFGDFEIERRDDGSLWELGRGATGVTYRALDRVLHRSVALKVIEPAAVSSDSQALRERFLREARAAAALRHPNVAGVFHFSASPELDRCYCAMELVEGETLEARVRREGPLKLGLALEIAIQVAHALVAAAERGLVHRDLKPGNIMLARDTDGPGGLGIKVIDFGLAKAIAAAGQMELTHGGFVGTPAFASPEQFAGGAIDARSDIYALGVTLWFILSGRLPSAGTSIEEIRKRQTHRTLPLEQLKLRTVPQPVIDLLRSCLAIDPADRPSSAQELVRALESYRDHSARRGRRRTIALAAVVALGAAAALLIWASRTEDPTVSLAPAPAEKAIAVLPFENLSKEKDDAFFVDGIQDDVLTSVGKIKDLKVIARNSVMNYRGARQRGKIREIGQTLGVSHVLDGSVRRAADRVVVNVTLLDTRDERQVWSERYERTLTDTISLQGELAVEIARALQATLTPAEQTIAAAKPTESPEAYLLFLRGRETEILRNVPDALESAIKLYQEAIDLDPAFALARARLSICASQQFYEGVGQPEWKTKARAEAEEALRLRPDLGEARLAMTYYHLMVERDHDRALAELSGAAELLPNSAEVPLTAAFIYKRQNRYRDRLAALQRAEALDPRNTRVLAFLILTYRWVRDWPEATRALDRANVLQPDVRTDRRRWARANVEFRRTGDLAVLRKTLAELSNESTTGTPEWLKAARYETAMLERDYAAAARLLPEVTPQGLEELTLPTGRAHSKAFHQALLAVATGADGAARKQALEVAQTELEANLSSASTPMADSKALAELALIHAFLGRKEEAVREAERSVALQGGLTWSIEKNACSASLALVYAQTGEAEKALELIEHLLTVPVELGDSKVYHLTLTDLKWRWVWDPLRSHPRFQKILAAPEPKTIY